MAANIPPGAFRKQFAFEKWPDFDEALYKTIREKQIERINDNPVRIYGNEINRFVIAKAEENVRNAGVEDMVQLSLGDFNDFERPSGNGVVIINPPYGEKLQPEDLEALYKSIGDRFKKHYAGYKAWIFTGSPEGAKAVGLRSNRKIKLFNGPIECRLLGYELFEGSKKDLYKE
jgi:putative N6-adenine-specific DNA methylase